MPPIPPWSLSIAVAALFGGVIVCMLPRAWGIVVVWLAAVAALALDALTAQASWVGVGVAMAVCTVLAALGYKAELWARRLGIPVWRISARTVQGAGYGIFIGLFVPAMVGRGGMLAMPVAGLLGALIGAWMTEASARREPAEALRTAFGAVVAIFGSEGLRLVLAVLIATIALLPHA